MLSIIEKLKQSKLNFEVNATATKVMALAGLLSAASPTLAKNPDSFSSNSGKSGVRTEKEIELPEALAPEQAQEWMTHTAPADALSVEKVNDLTDTSSRSAHRRYLMTVGPSRGNGKSCAIISSKWREEGISVSFQRKSVV